jgi:hypothetical protein
MFHIINIQIYDIYINLILTEISNIMTQINSKYMNIMYSAMFIVQILIVKLK